MSLTENFETHAHRAEGGNQNFAFIRRKGDHALFGKSTQAMKSQWGVPGSWPLADFAQAIILMAKFSAPSLTVETLTHDDVARKNIPTPEYQLVMQKDERSQVRFARGGQYCYPALTDVLRSMESGN